MPCPAASQRGVRAGDGGGAREARNRRNGIPEAGPRAPRAGIPKHVRGSSGALDIGQLVRHRVGLRLIGSLDPEPHERLGAGLAQQHPMSTHTDVHWAERG